jgi:hypothetical protein
MQKLASDFGLNPAPEALPEGVRVSKKKQTAEFMKVRGESKAARRMRRRNALVRVR